MDIFFRKCQKNTFFSCSFLVLLSLSAFAATRDLPTMDDEYYSSSDEEMEMDLRERGNEHFRNKEYEDAIDCYTQAIADEPEVSLFPLFSFL